MIAERLVVVLGVLWLLAVVLLGLLVVARAEAERSAYCEAMGETWQDRIELPDGSTMPGQCVDLGVRA